MERLPAGTRCAEAQEWVLAYFDAMVKVSVRGDRAFSATRSRGVAQATVETQHEDRPGRAVRLPRR